MDSKIKVVPVIPAVTAVVKIVAPPESFGTRSKVEPLFKVKLLLPRASWSATSSLPVRAFTAPNTDAIPTPGVVENVKVVVAMTGRLIPEEAIIYDFAHEDPGQGMIMPMARVERIDYLMTP